MSKHALLLKAYLYPYVKRARKDWRLTQEGMAERLRVSPRSYSDLEHGRSSFSAVSLVIFLTHFSDEKIVTIVRGFFRVLLQSEQEVA